MRGEPINEGSHTLELSHVLVEPRTLTFRDWKELIKMFEQCDRVHSVEDPFQVASHGSIEKMVLCNQGVGDYDTTSRVTFSAVMVRCSQTYWSFTGMELN